MHKKALSIITLCLIGLSYPSIQANYIEIPDTNEVINMLKSYDISYLDNKVLKRYCTQDKSGGQSIFLRNLNTSVCRKSKRYYDLTKKIEIQYQTIKQTNSPGYAKTLLKELFVIHKKTKSYTKKFTIEYLSMRLIQDLWVNDILDVIMNQGYNTNISDINTGRTLLSEIMPDSEFRKLIATTLQMEERDIRQSDLDRIVQFEIKDQVADMRGISYVRYIKSLSISGQHIKHISTEIGKLSKLESLMIQDVSATSIPNTIGDLSILKSLIINNNKNISELPSTIGKLQNLNNLKILNSKISELPEGIKSLKKLENLLVSSDNIKEIPYFIGGIDTLKILSIGGKQITEIPDNIGDLKRLEILSLVNTSIKKIPDGLENLSSLRWISIKGTEITEFPNIFSKLTNLQIVDIENTDIETLPEFIWDLVNLNTILAKNTNMTNVPNPTRNSTKLEYLDIGNTNILSLSKEIGHALDKGRLDISNTDIVSLPVLDKDILIYGLYLNNTPLTCEYAAQQGRNATNCYDDF